MGKLRVLDRTGDTVLTWDPVTEVETKLIEAKAEFDRKQKAGYAAFTQEENGEGKHISEFDPNASTIVMMAPIVGG